MVSINLFGSFHSVETKGENKKPNHISLPMHGTNLYYWLLNNVTYPKLRGLLYCWL